MIKFKIVVLGRGDADKLERCLKSLENQTYQNYDVCIIDDATYPKIMREQGVQAGNREDYQTIAMKYCDRNSTWILKVNNERKYGAFNHLQAIHLLNCKDEDVIVDLDADDYLFSRHSLKIVKDYYTDSTMNNRTNVWLTFGSHVNLSTYKITPTDSAHKQYELYKKLYKDVVTNLRKLNNKSYTPIHNEQNSIQTWAPGNCALRTYKYFLWKNITSKDFMLDGKFIKWGEDKVYMKAMMEMAGCNYVCIPQLLYVYDDVGAKRKQIEGWYGKLGFESEDAVTTYTKKLNLKITKEWKRFPLLRR